jgi:uncharacterized protein DUF4339
MYRMIGGDGNEYGPLTPEQLREFIAAGRANSQTRAKKEGDPDWKTLAEFPEFAEALAAKGAAALPGPTAAPAPGTAAPAPPALPGSPSDPEILAANVLARDYEVNIGLALGRAWDLLKSDFGPLVGVTALIMLVNSAASGILQGPLMGGLFAYYLKRIRGQPAEISDAFSGFATHFLQLFLGFLVSGLLITLGSFFCVLPGIYLGIAWQLTLPLIQDKGIGFWDAMEVSRKVLTRNWWGMFALTLICALANICGALCCLVGLLVTLPLTLIALAYIYEDLFGQTQAVPAAQLSAGTGPSAGAGPLAPV